MPGLRPQPKHGDDSGVPTLAELITAQKTESGLSYEEYAARTDFVISRQRFQQLGTKADKEFPEPATLTAVAKAIEVDVALVVLATAKSVGLDVRRGSESELAMMLPASARNLTRAQRNALLALIRSIVSRRPAALQDGEEWPGGWGPGGDEDAGVGGDEDGEQRNQL